MGRHFSAASGLWLRGLAVQARLVAPTNPAPCNEAASARRVWGQVGANSVDQGPTTDSAQQSALLPAGLADFNPRARHSSTPPSGATASARRACPSPKGIRTLTCWFLR